MDNEGAEDRDREGSEEEGDRTGEGGREDDLSHESHKRNTQLPIIQQLKVLSRGYLTARQRSNTLIYSTLEYLVLTYRMDNEGAADIDREGNDEEEVRGRQRNERGGSE